MPPEELAARVGAEPDETWRKGDLRGAARTRTHPFNGINYSSGLDERRSPTDHLSALIDRLRPHAAQIAVIAADPATHSTRITVAEHTLRDNIGAWADSAVARTVAEMGADLFFDVYFYGDED